MIVKKIQALWAVVDNEEILECFDTRLEALDYLWMINFDQNRGRTSLWDIEHGKT